MEGYQGGQKPGGHVFYREVKGAVLVEPDEEAVWSCLKASCGDDEVKPFFIASSDQNGVTTSNCDCGS